MNERPLGYELTTADKLVKTLRERPTAAFPHVVWELDDYRDKNIETTFTFDNVRARVAQLRLNGGLVNTVEQRGQTEQFGLPYSYEAHQTFSEDILLGQQIRYTFQRPGNEREWMNEVNVYRPYLKFGVYGFDDEYRHIGIEVTRYTRKRDADVDVYLLLEGKDYLKELRDPTVRFTVNDILAAREHVTRKLFVGDPGLGNVFQRDVAKRLGLL